MKRIHLLDEQTINQIAAGEVIEHPASVIKELIENALDSGATHLTLETLGGGRGLIRLSDDGWGMGEDDLLLAVERHATSKLTNAADLGVLGTLGFRGEALASIAAVSKMRLHSSLRESGWELTCEGGKLLKKTVLPRKRGTTVEVKSLFYNAPVRKKFQKSIGGDRAEIHKMLIFMALCHLKVGFTWISEGKLQWEILSDVELKNRIATLLSEPLAESMIPIEKGFVSGFISKPELHRPNRTGQYLFVNRRPVEAPLIARAVLEGYGTRLSTHRFPLFVLHLHLPPEQVDVNVHPQKKEVRFHEEQVLFRRVREAVERSFEVKRKPTFISMPTSVIAESIASYNTSAPLEPPVETPSFMQPRPRVATKVGSYLFVEEPEGVRIVDAKAAAFRLAYDELMDTKKEPAVQQLLVPIQIEAVGAEKTLLETHAPSFQKAGLALRYFGGNTFLIDAVPASFSHEDAREFVLAFLAEGASSFEKRVAGALKRAFRPRVGSLEAGAALVERLFQSKEPDRAPDGRATHLMLTENELARLFK